MDIATTEIISAVFFSILIIGFLLTMRKAFRDVDKRHAQRKTEVMAKPGNQEIEKRS